MKPILVMAVVIAAAAAAAQPGPGPFPSARARSRSGQFMVYATGGAGRHAEGVTNQAYIGLEPSLVAISAERIKYLLERQLEIGTSWRGRIYLTLFPARGANDLVTITAERFSDGWQYRVDMPDVLERTRYVRSLVQAWLQEMANREAHTHSSEVPDWLVEGLNQQLLASSQLHIILKPPPPQGTNSFSYTSTDLDVRQENPLKHAHEVLTARAPLTFEELSWWATGADNELYRSSAQLFVHELLQLPDGVASLRSMLNELPQYYNWQFAFLHAFRAHFSRPLDVEKWWTLQALHFTGRNLLQTWSVAESWEKLDDAVHSRTEERTGANDLPQPVTVSLQRIIRQWNSPTQKAALESKVVQLGSLRLRIAPEYVGLLDEYVQALQQYLRQNESLSFAFPFRKKAAARHFTDGTLKQLDTLDALRLTLHPKPTEVPVTQAAASPAAR